MITAALPDPSQPNFLVPAAALGLMSITAVIGTLATPFGDDRAPEQRRRSPR
jgi:hypothetical protein